MKKLLLFIILICFSVFTVFAQSSSMGDDFESDHNTGGYASHFGETDQETERFLSAKKYVFASEWDNAHKRLAWYLDKYPSGKYVDEALFWDSKALNKLSFGEPSLNRFLYRKENGFDRLKRLIEQYPESLWLDDAQVLMDNFLGELALLSKGNFLEKVSGFSKLHNINLHELKMKAVARLTSLDVGVAIAALEHLIKEENNPEILIKGIQTIGWHFPEDTEDILSDLAQSDVKNSIRNAAEEVLDDIRREQIPVFLNYYCFQAEISDRKQQQKIPEDRPIVFSIPRSIPGGYKQAEKTLKRFFKKRLKKMKLVASSRGRGFTSKIRAYTTGDFTFNIVGLSEGISVTKKLGLDKYVDNEVAKQIEKMTEHFNISDDYYSSISHRIFDYHFGVMGKDFKKDYDQISGFIQVKDVEGDEKHETAYTVSETVDQVVAIRDGKRISLMLLQFDSDVDTDLDDDGRPIYYTEFNQVLGCKVHSSRQSWSADEMGRIHGLMDYGQAKAEIPGEGGTWILEGNLLSDGKKEHFIGRDAELMNPDGDKVAQGSQIIVPAKDPHKFEIKKE